MSERVDKRETVCVCCVSEIAIMKLTITIATAITDPCMPT